MLDKYFFLYAFVMLSTVIITVLVEKRLIPYLKEHAKQPIYEDGPKWHISKSGTPTMGGLGFLISSFLSLLPAALILLINNEREEFIALMLSFLFSFGNSAIGMIDDIRKLKKKENAGLSPKEKLLLQFILALCFLIARAAFLSKDTSLHFSFGTLELGLFYYPIAAFVLLGLINSANLTDGIDGLAASVAFAIGISLFYISAALSTSSTIIASLLIGASIGFLFFNIHPAKIFMGDTGSLYLGALAAVSGFVLDNILITLLLCGVYVIEGFSVVLQVLYFRITGKRLFKMAPIHHHLEKSGFPENKICLLGIFITLLLAIPVYIFYLP